MIKCSLFDFSFNWLFGMTGLIWISRILHDHILYEMAITKITVEFRWISLRFAWFDTVDFNRLPCPNNKWRSLRWSIPLSIDDVWNAIIDRAISILSCPYCVRNSYCQDHRRNLPNSQLLSMIWYGWIQSFAMSKRHDVRWWCFADRFRF